VHIATSPFGTDERRLVERRHETTTRAVGTRFGRATRPSSHASACGLRRQRCEQGHECALEDATESLPDAVEEIARTATAAVGLDCAGVDLIEGEDDWAILEVNPTAGFKGLFQATGRSPAPVIRSWRSNVPADRWTTIWSSGCG
jgi:hypothetical protein